MEKDKNSLQTLRGFLFEEIVKLRKGEAVVQESIALSKLSSQVINSYKVEIEAVKVANELKDKNKTLIDKVELLRWVV